jgi:Cysteine-rich CPCC/Clp amino terminal domain, pathogenicity island component
VTDRVRVSAADRLLGRAAAEADELRHEWLGGDHFLLALLRPADESLAGQALRACGLTHDAYAREFARGLEEAEEAKPGRAERKKRGHIQPNPAAYTMMGRAEGLAAALGAAEAGPEHVLLSIIWDPQSPTTCVLNRLDTNREEIADHLRAAGVPLPAGGLPPLKQRRWGEKVVVPIEQLQALTALPKLLPPGAHYGFNHDGKDSAWLIASEEVDLPRYIAFALDAWERRRFPCSCCGYVTLDLDVPQGERRCDVCFWIQDAVQASDCEYRGGANEVSLIEARNNLARCGASQEKFTDKVRPPRLEEIPPWRAEQSE